MKGCFIKGKYNGDMICRLICCLSITNADKKDKLKSHTPSMI